MNLLEMGFYEQQSVHRQPTTQRKWTRYGLGHDV